MPDQPLFRFAPPVWLDEIDSTNDEIKRRLAADETLPSGLAVAARLQTKGKGRLGRAWHAAGGTGLTFSFLWRGGVRLDAAGTLPMACALAVGDFLAGLGVPSQCKWPNDVLTEHGKICGILAESSIGRESEVRLVMGIGVNIRPDADRDGRIDQPAACVELFNPNAGPPETLLPRLLEKLAERVGAWQAEGFAAIRPDLEARLRGVGRPATVRVGNGIVKGTVTGLGENGELLLTGEDGSPITVISAAALDAPA